MRSPDGVLKRVEARIETYHCVDLDAKAKPKLSHEYPITNADFACCLRSRLLLDFFQGPGNGS
jgi:hypothetical protein